MPRPDNVFLNQYIIILKCFQSFSFARFQTIIEVFLFMDNSHSFASSTRYGFDQDWEHYLLGFLQKQLRILVGSVVAWDYWDSGLGHDNFGCALGCHLYHSLGRGTNKSYVVIFTLSHKVGVLRQETKPRVDSLASRILADLNNLIGVEVRFQGRIRSNSVSFVSHLHELGVSIDVTMDGNSFNSQSLGCSENPAGNLSSIGYQKLFNKLNHVDLIIESLPNRIIYYQFQLQVVKMHNFIVPNKYQHITRIGNWSEEWELNQVKKKDALKNGNSREKILTTYQPASLSLSPDGYYHFKDHLMFYNGKTQGFLAVDVLKPLSKTQELYEVSTGQNLHPSKRTVFIIERVDPLDGHMDDILHYGQHFRIKINERLLQRDVYLHSELVSLTKYSPISRLQEVNFGLKQSYSTVWTLEDPDPNLRFEKHGKPVKVDDNVLIKHIQTNQWLASDTKPVINNYGEEFEVMVHNFYVKSKSHNLSQEKKGAGSIDIPTKGQTAENIWVIVGAADASQQFQEEIGG